VRVLILTNLYPNPYQPTRAVFNRQQFRALAEQHSVRIIAPLSWVDELKGRARGKAKLPRDRQLSCDGILVEHPRYFYPPRSMRGWHGHCYRRSVRSAFRRAVKEFHPDIILGSWAYPDGWAAVQLARQVGLPVAIKIHGCDVLYAGEGLDGNPVRKQRTIEALCGADGVLAVSQHLADGVIKLGVDPQRVKVVHNGIDTGLFHPGSKEQARHGLDLNPSDRIVLFVGNLVPVKAIDVLIEAASRLVQTGFRFQCLLIGQGPLRPHLERQVAKLGLTETVRFLGGKPHGDLPQWYRAADLVVLPSRSEGIPNVLLEAAACGTPFVASRVGGIPEIAHLGMSQLVPSGDADALAGAIKQQLSVLINGAGRTAGRLRGHREAADEITALLEWIVEDRIQCHPEPAYAARESIVPITD
jgi:glycosyltransferase involved in cell wall biosynthesis